MKRISTSLLALAAGLFVASPAMATDLTTPADAYAGKAPINWTSIYIGGQIGYGNSNHHLNKDYFSAAEPARCDDGTLDGGTLNTAGDGCEDAGTFVPAVPSESVYNAFLNGLNSKGIFGGGTIGFDVQKGKFVFGAFADYNVSDATYEAGKSGQDWSASGSITDGNSWLAAVRAGVALGSEQRTLLYGLAGYGQQDVTYNGILIDCEDLTGDRTFSGWVAGGGIEYAISQAATIGVEYQHFFGGKETLFDGRDPDTGAGVLVTDDLDTNKVMAKLKLKLSPGLFGY